MWTCEKCGRGFEKRDQHHFCIAPSAIDEYIAEAPEAVRETLFRVRETIRASAPNATEKISWRMPTFWQKENLIHFAAQKKHMGLYPGDEAVAAFADRLTAEGYSFSKGSIRLPWDKPMPYELIEEITRYRVSKVEG